MEQEFEHQNNRPQELPESGSDRYAAQSGTKPKNEMRKLVALALCFSLLGSVLGAAGVLLVTGRQGIGQTQENLSGVLMGNRENSVIGTVDVETGTRMTPAQVYAANVNSTVGITTSITTNYWGFQSTSAASGSGFIISDDGYILTNYHVIEDSDSITVAMYDGTGYDAALVGYDAGNDIAVLKIDAKGLAPVILGDSDNLNVGDSVVAIGNPLGELTFSLTAGAVSAKDRQVTFSGGITMDLIQTDCAINSGNSGGALFNLYGEVIGITNAKYSGSGTGASIDNIGFAIPMNSVWNIIESLIEKGYVSKPYVGVTVSDVSVDAQRYGIPAGAAVQSVAEDSPAQRAGLQPGDVITSVNATAVTGSSDLVRFVNDAEIGDSLLLNVFRQGQTVELTVVVEEKIQPGAASDNRG